MKAQQWIRIMVYLSGIALGSLAVQPEGTTQVDPALRIVSRYFDSLGNAGAEEFQTLLRRDPERGVEALTEYLLGDRFRNARVVDIRLRRVVPEVLPLIGQGRTLDLAYKVLSSVENDRVAEGLLDGLWQSQVVSWDWLFRLWEKTDRAYVRKHSAKMLARVEPSSLEELAALEPATDQGLLLRGQAYARFASQLAQKPETQNAEEQIAEAHRRALADFDRALEVHPDWAEALAWRGAAHLALNEPEAALTDLSRALVFDPDLIKAYAWRSRVLERLGRQTEAAADQEMRRHVEARLAREMRAQKEAEEVTYLRTPEGRSQRIGEADREAWIALDSGSSYYAEQALQKYGQVLRYAPEDREVLLKRAMFQQHFGRFVPALADYDALLKVAPEATYVYALRAVVQEHLGLMAKSQQDRATYNEHQAHLPPLPAESLDLPEPPTLALDWARLKDLATARDSRNVPTLAQAVADPHLAGGMRVTALDALELYEVEGLAPAVPWLELAVLDETLDSNQRGRIVRLLQRSGLARSASVLEEVAYGSKDPLLAEAAVKAIGQLPANIADRYLESLLRRGATSPSAVRQAVTQLHERPDWTLAGRCLDVVLQGTPEERIHVAHALRFAHDPLGWLLLEQIAADEANPVPLRQQAQALLDDPFSH